MKKKIKELKEQAQELIELGDSREKAKGYGMMAVINEWNNFKPMELLKPVIMEMALEKTIEDISGREGYIELNMFNENNVLKEEYQGTYNRYYDEFYNYLNVF
jgi:hypothetical protein